MPLFQRRPYTRSRTRSPSTSEEEIYVDRSLPSSPIDSNWSAGPNEDRAGTSRAYRFALEDDGVRRYAREAFDGPPVDDMRDEGLKVEEEEDELREINEEDQVYLDNQAYIGDPDIRPLPDHQPRHHFQLDEDEEETQEEEEDPPDQRQCRICFAGREEEAVLGRLISPCLCSGSMRYVHVQCINAWRGTGTNSKAFMECPQCKHRYTLRRTLISGLATSRPILLLLSTLLFLFLSITSGHILHRYLLSSPPTPKKRQSYRSSIFDLFEEDWDTFDNGVIIVGGGLGGGGTLIWDVVMGSIQTFTEVANNFLVREGWGSSWFGGAVQGLAVRFLLGLAVLGSLSFLSLLLSLSLFAPLNFANGLRGTGIFRRRNNANGGGTPAGQIMIIIFVLIGAINTLVKVYRLTERISERLLKYVETQILEVNPRDRKSRTRRKWYKVWWEEGRWARREGWEEVRVRLWLAAREGLGPVWERMWAGGERGLIE